MDTFVIGCAFVIVVALIIYLFSRGNKTTKSNPKPKPKPNPNILGGAETEGMNYQIIRNALHKLRKIDDLFKDVITNHIVVKEGLGTTKTPGTLGVADYPTKTIYISMISAKSMSLNKMVWLLLHEAAHIKFKHLATSQKNETQANNYARLGLKRLELTE